jgi:modulator of FtsH protease HflK
MSTSSDHPHHDHDHDHDHDHPHSHAGAHARPGVQEAPPAGPAAPASVEDPGTQALAEALRSSFVIVKVIMVLLVILFFASGVFIVPPNEKAIILRFGKPVGTAEDQLLGPGLHWSFPSPIDEVVRIQVGQLQSLSSTVGWYATFPGIENMPAQDYLDLARDGYTLTADGNILHVRATIEYRINDPLSYYFQFSSTSNLVQNALNNSILYASSRYTVDRALRLDLLGFKETINSRLNELIEAQNLGVTVETADIRVDVPRFLRPSFEEVHQAEQDFNRVINQARGYEGEELSRAWGNSNVIVNASMADYVRLTNSIAAEARYLAERNAEYERNPDLFQQRMHLETMQRVLSNAREQHIMPANRGGSTELRLLFGREPVKRQAPEEEPDDHRH